MGINHTILSKLNSFKTFNVADRRSIVWLDDSMEEDQNLYFAIENKLRSVFNRLKIFKQVNKCQKYLRTSPKGDHLILVVNEKLSHVFLSKENTIRQLIAIYIFPKAASSPELYRYKLESKKLMIHS